MDFKVGENQEREENNMQLVKYRKINDEEVKNLVDGQFYWIDENSKTEKEYRIFVDVYSYENKTEKIGSVEEYRFLNVSKLILRKETTVEVKEKALYGDDYYCPVCGNNVEPESHYCPHCGSVMGWEILW